MGLTTWDMENQEVQGFTVERFQDFTDTIKTYYDMIQIWQPGKPIFIIGHSMGGLIAAVYLLDHQQDFAGAVLSGPGVKIPDHISSGTITIAKIFSKLMPKLGLILLYAKSLNGLACMISKSGKHRDVSWYARIYLGYANRYDLVSHRIGYVRADYFHVSGSPVVENLLSTKFTERMANTSG